MYNVIGDYMNFDSQIILYTSKINNVFLDYFFKFFTHLGDYGIICILIGIVFLFWKKTRKTGVTILASMVLVGIFGNLILKPTVHRMRPFDRFGYPLKIKAPTDFSFPSGHTYSAFSLFSSVFFNKEVNAIPFFILAVLISASRIYFAVHYPTDVAAGIVMGILAGYISNYIVNRRKK